MAVVRQAIDAFASGDVVTALNLLAPDIEWHGTVGGMDEGHVAHGRDEVAKGFIEYFENWERIELRAEKYIDARRGDAVVVFHHEVAKGRESGVVVETDTATINTVRRGKIVRVRPYMERAEALRVAGLPPDAAHSAARRASSGSK